MPGGHHYYHNDDESVDLLQPSGGESEGGETPIKKSPNDSILSSQQQQQHQERWNHQTTRSFRTTVAVPPPGTTSSWCPPSAAATALSSVVYSPATQTLNALQQSQETVDLRHQHWPQQHHSYYLGGGGDATTTTTTPTTTTTTTTTNLSQLELNVVNALVMTKKVVSIDDDMDDEDHHQKEEEEEEDDHHMTTATTTTKHRSQLHSTKNTSLPSSHTSGNTNGNANTIRRRSRPQTAPHPPTTNTPDSSSSTTTTSPPKKRGRLADSERRDIHQIRVATGEIVQTFTSFSQAGQANNFSRHIVAQILRGTYTAKQQKGQHNQYQGWTFRYADEDDPSNHHVIPTDPHRRPMKHNNPTHNNIVYQHDRQDHPTTKPDPPVAKSAVVVASPARGSARNIPILATRQGTRTSQTFPSILSASKKTLVPRKQIAAIVRGELSEFQGWTFRTISHSDNELEHANNDIIQTEASPQTTSLSISPKEEDPTSPPKSHDPTSSMTGEPPHIISSLPKIAPPLAAATSPSPPSGLNNDTDRTRTTTGRSTSTTAPRHSKQAIPVEEYDATTQAYLRTYRSLTMAAEKSGANRHIITAVLKGKMNHWNGLKWRYSNHVEPSYVEPSSLSSSSEPATIIRNNIVDESSRSNNEVPQIDPQVQSEVPNDVPSSDISERPSDSNDYIVENIVIETRGALGILAKRVKVPEAVLSLLNIHSDPNESNNLLVESLVGDETSIARTCGIKAGDYLFAPNEELTMTIDDNYDSVVELLGRPTRPITLNAVRLKSSPTGTNVQQNDAASHSTNEGERDNSTSHGPGGNPAGRNGTNSGQSNYSHDNHKSSDIDSTDLKRNLQELTAENTKVLDPNDSLSLDKTAHTAAGLVPFCALCNGRNTIRPIHHSWCPKNDHFDTSGADEVLARIQRGLEMSCEGCQLEYQSGRRAPDDTHAQRCRGGHKATPSVNPKMGSVSEPEKTENTNKQDKCTTVTILKGSKPVIATGIVEAKPSKRNEAKVASKPIVTATKSVGSKNRTTSAVAVAKKSKPKLPAPPQLSDDDSLDDSDNGEKLNVTWDECHNVWGYEGHHDNDIVIYSTSNIGCHYESMFLDERYEMFPFMACRQYRKTHCSPEEGYQAIVLRRDMLGRRPWGLTCVRHEFGGACLVDSVEPLSPADAGTLLGSGVEGKAPLRVNDMVVAVNGKSVGGMTLTGLEIEFELAGPDMILLVSRYKFTDNVHDKVTQLEHTHINAFDVAMNDSRQVGWIEFGAPSPTTGLSGLMSHTIRPSPDNMDDSTTCYDSDRTMDDDSVNRIKSQAATKNVLFNTKTVTPFANVRLKSKSAFVSVSCHDSDKKEATKNPAASNCLRETVPVQRSKSNIHENFHDKNIPAHGATDTDDDYSDDGNPWCGCVCGQTHPRKTTKHTEIFWIQCDVCSTWYDCSSTCVGFTSSDAKAKLKWICWGCPTLGSDPSTLVTRATTEISKPLGRVSISPVTMETATGQPSRKWEILETTERQSIAIPIAQPKPHQNDVTLPVDSKAQTTKSLNESRAAAISIIEEPKQQQESNANDDVPLFAVGDFVYVEEHSWARVNNPEGIATVLKAYTDGDGDQVYDIRYVIGGKASGVLPEYLTRYVFP